MQSESEHPERLHVDVPKLPFGNRTMLFSFSRKCIWAFSVRVPNIQEPDGAEPAYY